MGAAASRPVLVCPRSAGRASRPALAAERGAGGGGWGRARPPRPGGRLGGGGGGPPGPRPPAGGGGAPRARTGGGGGVGGAQTASVQRGGSRAAEVPATAAALVSPCLCASSVSHPVRERSRLARLVERRKSGAQGSRERASAGSVSGLACGTT